MIIREYRYWPIMVIFTLLQLMFMNFYLLASYVCMYALTFKISIFRLNNARLSFRIHLPEYCRYCLLDYIIQPKLLP